MEKPTVVINFSNGDVLKHYGIPGMRWGFRKREDYEQYRSNITNIKKERKAAIKKLASNYKKNKPKIIDEIKKKGLANTFKDKLKRYRAVTKQLADLEDKYLSKELMADTRKSLDLRKWVTKNKNANYKKMTSGMIYLVGDYASPVSVGVSTRFGISSLFQLYGPGSTLLRFNRVGR